MTGEDGRWATGHGGGEVMRWEWGWSHSRKWGTVLRIRGLVATSFKCVCVGVYLLRQVGEDLCTDPVQSFHYFSLWRSRAIQVTEQNEPGIQVLEMFWLKVETVINHFIMFTHLFIIGYLWQQNSWCLNVKQACRNKLECCQLLDLYLYATKTFLL